MHALPLIWMLSGLLVLLAILLVVVKVRGDDGKSGKMGIGVSVFDIVERATGRTISKTMRLSISIMVVALLLGLALFLRASRANDEAARAALESRPAFATEELAS